MFCDWSVEKLVDGLEGLNDLLADRENKDLINPHVIKDTITEVKKELDARKIIYRSINNGTTIICSCAGPSIESDARRSTKVC